MWLTLVAFLAIVIDFLFGCANRLDDDGWFEEFTIDRDMEA